MIDYHKCSSDPIPADAIRISEAFDKVFGAIKKEPKALDRIDSELKELLVKNRQQEERRDLWNSKPPKAKEAHHRVKEAVVFFRSELRRGELIAYIRDPEEKDVTLLQLDSLDWRPFSNRLLLLEPPYAFEDDFVENDPFSGNPNTFIRGAFRPVFFKKKEFETWFAKVFGPQRHAGGRPKGTASFAAADWELIREMHDLIQSKQAKSANEAAGMVQNKARGASPEAKIARLRKAYRKEFPLD